MRAGAVIDRVFSDAGRSTLKAEQLCLHAIIVKQIGGTAIQER
jgi:hypothetical protein